MIHSVSLWRFQVPFLRKLPIRDGELAQRQGLLIRWQTEAANTVWSEVSPLPTYGHESLAACEQQLKLFFAHQMDLIKRPSTQLEEALSELYPSVQFGLETGLLLTQAKRFNDLTLLNLDNAAETRLPVCTLIDANDRTSCRGENKVNSPAIKVKVGRSAVADDIRHINAILENIDASQWLRLDANQSWSIAQAQTFFDGIACERIEYIEEPLAQRSSYQDWSRKLSVPFAWDEYLREPDTIVRPVKGLAALVVKPMLSGLGATLRFAEIANKLDLKLIISSAYETSITLNFLYRLAGALPNPQPPGLDTHQISQFDVLEQILFTARPSQKPLLTEDQLSWVATYS